MSAPVLTRAKVMHLAKQAAHHVAMQESTRRWSDLWPIVEPFANRKTRTDIADAVEWLISNGHIEESDRPAAVQAFRRERAKREAIAAAECNLA